ncbi:MAG: Holliday junction branch migration protein RuvA [Pseudomonadota bacterium]
MIGKLTGKVDAIGESLLIIDVGGVGYEVQASARALRSLSVGDTASLTIDTHVREDAIKLYGFASEVERSWFRTLQGVQGVGAKVALAILGIMSPQDIANAIAMGNLGAVGQAPGVGKKLAQRIVTELKDKVPALSVAGLNTPSGSGLNGNGKVEAVAAADDGSLAAAEAISALSNLGYQPMQASEAVATAMQDLGDGATTAALIKGGLKALAAR